MQRVRINNSISEKFKRIYSMFLNDKLALISIIFLILGNYNFKIINFKN